MDRLTGPLGLIDAARRTQTIDHWIFQELHVKTRTADRPVQQLSGGNQQRVVLAKWLATEPRVLILDSPTVGVDIGAKAGIYQVIDALAARGLAIILISDEVEEVLHGSHRILVMLSGRITATYDPHRVSEQELLEAIHSCFQEKIPYIVIGKGSNSLFDDRGFDGLVILNKINFRSMSEPSILLHG